MSDSYWRTQARAIIHPVVERMHGRPRKEIRAALREAYSGYAWERRGWAYQVWLEEVRYALGERTRKPARHPAARPLEEKEVMPSMRGWAKRHGLVKARATLDVDLPL